MSSTPPTFPFRIDALDLPRNNTVPDARFINRVANAQNHIQAFRRKQVFLDIGSAQSGSTAIVAHRGYFHSGHNAQGLIFDFVMARAGHASSNPFVQFDLSLAGGGGPGIKTFYWGASAGSSSSAPNDLLRGQVAYTITADANYVWSASVSNVGALDDPIMKSLSVYELGREAIDPAVNYLVSGAGAYSLINDANRQRYHQGLSKVWQHNGAHILSWSRGNSTSATSASVTWTNIIDGTTAVASTSAGFALGSNLLAPYCRSSEGALGVMPMATLAVYGSQAVGGGGAVRLMTDAAVGSPTLCSVVVNSASPGWFVSNQRLGASNFGPNAFTKADLQFQASGFGTLTIDAVALFLYET